MRIDLHTHSSRSDGTDAPADLVARSASTGLDVVALTDHDTTAGWDEAVDAARRHGVRLVRGIELSTRYAGRSVHLLAYLPDPAYPPLVAELARINEGREGRLPAMVRRLRELGHDLTEDDVRRAAAPGATLGRPHVADALVAIGAVADRGEAFDTLLGPRGPAFVARYATELPDAVALVRAAGGAPVVAHPWGRSRVLHPSDFASLAGLGLVGLEADHHDHSPQERAELHALAGRLGLVATGSSDHHGTGKVDHDLGSHTTTPEQYDRLVAAAADARVASGRPSPEVV